MVSSARSSDSSESRKKLTFASSASSAADVCKVDARSGTGDEKYESGVSGRWAGSSGGGGVDPALSPLTGLRYERRWSATAL